MEQAGIPRVVITTTGFTQLAQLTGKANGITGLRTAEYPGPVGIHSTDVMEQNIRTVLFDRIVDGLTQPAKDEGGTGVRGKWDPRKIVFSGTLEEVNRFFTANELSDGLAVVPPTVDRILQFLA